MESSSSSESATTSSAPGTAKTRIIRPDSAFMKYRTALWQQGLEGLANYRKKFGDTAVANELYQKKVLAHNKQFVDVIRDQLGLESDDKEAAATDEKDLNMFIRNMLSTKQIKDEKGRKLHIYKDRDNFYRFVDTAYIDSVGIKLRDMKHFVEHYNEYEDVFRNAYIQPYMQIFGYKIMVPFDDYKYANKDLLSTTEATLAFWDILKAMYSQLKTFLSENEMLPKSKEDDDDTEMDKLLN